ncbi:cysteine desulfurase family protein [Algibacter sp. L4_22]|uniref:cysteine desulfurase family protein n=1 Tax=Algibacter sp. L4_22 TaxID=2942477 RepID=UPI00201B8B95|nr:cysteine desulfurase family protein [Algibacter sp. L4_22]MCL5129113.1 cysteine desulfurase [Algibacter sp. L4_22]
MKPVYFDNAATTELRDEVVNEITKVLKTNFGNASSSHSFGRSSKSLIEKSRKAIASCLNVSASEIIFTSGGTEADNLILNSAVRDLEVKHIITSRIEHHAVLHTVEALQNGFNIEVSYINLDTNGNLDFEHLESLLQTNKKTLVSLMHINNEIGNITDIKRVANLCKANNAFFHSDTVQSVGHYNLDLQDIKVDFITAAGHKFHGPKGVGFAFIRKNVGYVKPLIFGGEQERGLRAGTESVHNIAGLELALTLMKENAEKEHAYIKGLKLYFIDEISKALPGVTFNGLSGDLEKSAYTIINVCLPFVSNKLDMILFQLDLKGIACSKGSACQSGSNKKSHVLLEILSPDALEKPSLRFSFSIFNTKEEIDYVISVLKEFA